MKVQSIAFALLSLLAISVQAAPPDNSCEASAVAARQERAEMGDAHAQYWLGAQLQMGACGVHDPKQADVLLQKAASQNFPPAVHMLGVILRRDGKDSEAIKYFEKSASLGFQLGFTDMGFTYGQSDSPIKDAALSYAWFTVAIGRESKEQLRQYLEATRGKIEKALSYSELMKAKSIAAELGDKYSRVPVWSDQ